MKSFLISSILALAATNALAQYTNQSPPFHLQIVSKNATLNGAGLASCHEGAAIEGLCLSTYPGDVYYFNTSTLTTDPSGFLIYNLEGANFLYSETMDFYYYPTSNVALPLFEPEEYGTAVQFDDKGLMTVPGSINDEVTPPTYENTPTLYKRWAICETYFTGYTYTTLSWIMGPGKAENPSCQSVNVKQIFDVAT